MVTTKLHLLGPLSTDAQCTNTLPMPRELSECEAKTTMVVLVVASIIVLGMGSAVIHAKADMDRELVEVTCDISNAVTDSQTEGVCHEATISNALCSASPLFNASISFPVTIVFPQIRVAGKGGLVCNKKEELNLPPTNTNSIRASCDVRRYFHSDVLCHYGSYTAAGWIAGVVLAVLILTAAMAIVCYILVEQCRK